MILPGSLELSAFVDATAAVTSPVAPTAPALRVVEPARHRFPARAVLTLAVLVVFGSLLVSAMVHSMLVSGQARIDDLGGQIRAERKALEDDRLRLAEASRRSAEDRPRPVLVWSDLDLIAP